MQDNKVKVKSLYKALKLLDYFSAKQSTLGVSEIAEKECLPKSTVSNIFSTFCAYGLLEQVPESGKFKLGPKLAKLSNIYFSTNSSSKVLKAQMEEVSKKIKQLDDNYFAVITVDRG